MIDERGLLHKYNVFRVDGSDEEGGKHCGCDYFVLDLTHDPDAALAAAYYAGLCSESRPNLSADLQSLVSKHQVRREVGE